MSRARQPSGRRQHAALVGGLIGVGAAALLTCCAKREPPSGGPPDIEPPRIVSTTPDSGAAGVAIGDPIAITFSEGMEPRSTQSAVSFAPPLEIGKMRWRGRTLTLVPAETLQTDQTYTMFVASVARDRHGNPMTTGAAIVFSTADRFPAGRIEGEIEARGLPAAGIYIWCYDADVGAEPDSTARDFDALGQADREGRFRVDGLRVPGRFRLWTFADMNNNRSFEPESDLLAKVDTVIALTDEQPEILGLVVRVLNPRAPASVSGVVSDTLGEAKGALRIRAVSTTDTTRTVSTTADEEMDFEIELPPGRWQMRAYRDLDGDRVWDIGVEPASDPIVVELGPADSLKDLELVLKRPDTSPP